LGNTQYPKLFGAPTPEIWESQKVESLARFGTTLDLTMNILGIDRDIKNQKQTGSTMIPAGLNKKFSEL